MILLYIILACVVILSLLLHWFQTKSYTAKLLKEFPGPWMPPLLGHAVMFGTKPEVMFPRVRRIGSSYKETLRAWSLYYPTLHIFTADDAEIILSSMKEINKGEVYRLLEPWLQDGLLLSTDQKWHQRRKLLTPTFHFNVLKRYVAIFADHCDDLVRKLNVECTKSHTNIIPLLSQLTLANISECTMGTKLDPKDKAQKNYLDALNSFGSLLVKRVFQPWLYSDFLLQFFPLGWKMRACVRTLHEFTRKVIEDRKRNFKDEDVENLDEPEDLNARRKRLTMLDFLISFKNRENAISDEGIQEEIDTFIFEGHDTTSSAIRHILLTLANHPDVQEKIITELDDIFGKSKRQASYDDLQQMKYTEMCIKECLRLYPSVPFILRGLKEDLQLTNHTAPAGTIVFVHIYHIQQDSKYFPEPEKFDPDRFLPENSNSRHPFAYIPFSAGPRNCIGQRFAMLELKCIIAAVLRNFRMEAIDKAAELTWVLDFVLRNNGPINIKFLSRENEENN